MAQSILNAPKSIGKMPELRFNSFLTYRIILFLSAIITLVIRYFFIKNAVVYDPMIIRVSLSLLLLLILGLTYFKVFHEKITYLGYLVFFFYAFHSLVLIHKNEFSINYILEFIIINIIICLTIKEKKHLLYFLITITVCYSIISYIHANSLLDIILNIALIASFTGAIFFFFIGKIDVEKQLESHDKMLQTIFEESPDALLIINPENFKIEIFNNATQNYFDFTSKEELKNRNFNLLLKTPYSEHMLNTISKKIKEKGHYAHEIIFKSKFNREFWGNMVIRPLQYENSYKWLVRISDTTQRHEDKKIIEQNRKMLMQIIDLVPHQIYLKDNNSRFLLVNQAVGNNFKLAKEELIGKSDFELFEMEKASTFLQQEQEVINNGRTIYDQDEIYYDENGLKRHIKYTKMPFYINEIKEYGILGVNYDITELTEKEEELKKSESKFRKLMEQASDGIYIANSDGIIIDANPKAAKMFGIEKENLIGSNIKEKIVSSNISNNPFSISKIDKDKSLIIERRFAKYNGEEFDAELSISLLESGGHQGIMRDITERKKIEDLLVENERKFRALIENSSDIIAILNQDLNIKFVSSSVLKILNYHPRKIESVSPLEMIHPKDLDRVKTMLNKVQKNPKDIEFLEEVRIKSSTGAFMYFEIHAYNLLNDPSVQGIVVNCHDIDERKKAELELINTNYELDSFVYRASHDIKAPLRSVMGLITLAQLENKDNSVSQYLEMMNKSVHNLDSFIKDLTLFSRNTRLDLEPRKINFDTILTESIDSLLFMDNADQVEIDINIDKKLKFYSDITRVSTIFNNLISNSLKYHKFDNNNPFIKIWVADNGDKHAIIEVEDNGLGIDKKYINNIFDMFFRASESSYGSGLGLYIVKTAVSKLNGKISVESELGKGTKFTVLIPNLK